ncbi:hypothetical protein TNCV_147991 [Trichonephila clavipes]|nr:hypothetical protein TNCV_147991 [Trichonephila clavipes]
MRTTPELCHSCIQLVVLRTRVAFCGYSTLSREAVVMVAVRTVYAAANVVAPYQRILGVLQMSSHHTSGYWACCKRRRTIRVDTRRAANKPIS